MQNLQITAIEYTVYRRTKPDYGQIKWHDNTKRTCGVFYVCFLHFFSSCSHPNTPFCMPTRFYNFKRLAYPSTRSKHARNRRSVVFWLFSRGMSFPSISNISILSTKGLKTCFFRQYLRKSFILLIKPLF